MIERNYADQTDLMEDVMFDAKRNIPVEIVCQAKDAKFFIGYICTHSDAPLDYLDYNLYYDGILPEDEIAVAIDPDGISVSPLVYYKDGEKKYLESAYEQIRYVSNKCNEYFYNCEEAIVVIRYDIGG